MAIFDKKRGPLFCLRFAVPGLLFFMWACTGPVPAFAADLGKAVSLKIRMYVQPEPSLGEKLNEKDKLSGTHQKVVISIGKTNFDPDPLKARTDEDWACGLLRAVKSAAADSDTIRVMSDAGKNNDAYSAQYSLLVDGEYDGKVYSVYLLMVDVHTRDIIAESDAASEDKHRAAGKAVRMIEDQIMLNPWRCRVSRSVGSNQFLIPRGYGDGIYKGLEFTGYAFSRSHAEQQAGLSEELSILQYDNTTGRYRVVEAMRNHSKLTGLNGSPRLKAGDIIEMPGAVLEKDHPRQSKGRKAWQKIFKQN